MKAPNLSPIAAWRKRFQVPSIAWTAIASQNPARGIVCTNKNNIYQLFAWDVPSGQLPQRTYQAGGTTQGAISADGETLYYHDAALGHYVRVPFADTGSSEPDDLSPALPQYNGYYITESHSGSHLSFCAAYADLHQIFVLDSDGRQVFTYENPELSIGANLAHDGTIAVIATTEHTPGMAFSLEAYELPGGALLNRLQDAHNNIQPIGFIPKAGDERFVAVGVHNGFERPLVWHPRTGERQTINSDRFNGDVTVWDWSEDGRYLLLCDTHHARQNLYLYDFDSASVTDLTHPAGTYSGAYFTAWGTIHAHLEDSRQPARLVELNKSGEQNQAVLQASGVPQGVAWESVTFASADGTQVQAWLAQPTGDPPFPMVVHLHGGPTDVMTEVFSAGSQAWVEHGCAFLSVNYRGSTTFGDAFQQAIIGNIGKYELDDIQAAAQWAIDNHIAHPDKLFITGSSYGAYLTLQALSKQATLWAGGMAIAAITDWSAMVDSTAPMLQAYAQQLFGGTSQDKPHAYTAASPMSHVQQVTSPILIIQGENDPRIPAKPVETYAKQLAAQGNSIDLIWFDATRGNDLQIEHQEMMLNFVYRVLAQQ